PPDFERYDALLATDDDRAPWSPDNSTLSDAERADGWIALFDGHSMSGWTGVNGMVSAFKAEAGELRYIGRLPDADDIRTTRRYDDFILKLEFQIGSGGNSGIFLRAPRTARASKIGMEFQIMGDHGQPAHRNGTGAVYDVVAPRVNALRPY